MRRIRRYFGFPPHSSFRDPPSSFGIAERSRRCTFGRGLITVKASLPYSQSTRKDPVFISSGTRCVAARIILHPFSRFVNFTHRITLARLPNAISSPKVFGFLHRPIFRSYGAKLSANAPSMIRFVQRARRTLQRFHVPKNNNDSFMRLTRKFLPAIIRSTSAVFPQWPGFFV